VIVQRSDNGGRTFGDPVLVQDETDCNVLNDKNRITVDTFPPNLTWGPLNSARFLGQMSCLVDHAAAAACTA
jgi:hypothetical protein